MLLSEVSRNGGRVPSRPSLVVEESGAASVRTFLGQLSRERGKLGVDWCSGRKLERNADRRTPGGVRRQVLAVPTCIRPSGGRRGYDLDVFLFIPKIKEGDRREGCRVGVG